MNKDRIVNSITDLLDYQDGSVVSKILIKKGTGNVTLFVFDKDQRLSEHTTPYDALVQGSDGKADIIWENLI